MKYHDEDPTTLWMHTGDVGIMNEEGYLRGMILTFHFCRISRSEPRSSQQDQGEMHFDLQNNPYID